MNKYALLLNISGLSISEAADFHGVRLDTVKSWRSGRNRAPDGALNEIASLVDRQRRVAEEALALIRKHPHAEAYDIFFPTDDKAARDRGWPSRSAHSAMLSMMMAAMNQNQRAKITFGGDAARIAARVKRSP